MLNRDFRMNRLLGARMDEGYRLESLDEMSQISVFGYSHQFSIIRDKCDGFTLGQGKIQAVIHRMIKLNGKGKGPWGQF